MNTRDEEAIQSYIEASFRYTLKIKSERDQLARALLITQDGEEDVSDECYQLASDVIGEDK